MLQSKVEILAYMNSLEFERKDPSAIKGQQNTDDERLKANMSTPGPGRELNPGPPPND